MFLGSDALAVGPFTNRVAYLDEGDYVAIDHDRRPDLRRRGPAGRAADRRSSPPRPPWSRRATTATSWKRRSMTSRRAASAPSRPMSTRSPAATAMPGGIDFASARAHPDRRLRHRLHRRPDRQVPDRAAGRPAGRRRDRLGVPLPRAGAAAGHPGHRHVAVGRDRRHPGRPALLPGQGHEERRRGQRRRNRPWPARSTWSGRSTAGPEIGVASTKAFTAQVSVLTALAVAAARARGRSTRPRRQRLVRVLLEAPRLIAESISLEDAVRAVAVEIAKARDVLYLGRGPMYAAGPGRRAEAEGNQLHPRRGLCRRRAEARPDRPGRRARRRSSSWRPSTAISRSRPRT